MHIILHTYMYYSVLLEYPGILANDNLCTIITLLHAHTKLSSLQIKYFVKLFYSHLGSFFPFGKGFYNLSWFCFTCLIMCVDGNEEKN